MAGNQLCQEDTIRIFALYPRWRERLTTVLLLMHYLSNITGVGVVLLVDIATAVVRLAGMKPKAEHHY